MTTSEVARLLNVTTVTVTKYVRRGLLTKAYEVQPFLFEGAEVEKFRRELFPLLRPGRPGKGKSAVRRGRRK